MLMTYSICCEASGKIAPPRTTYTRPNIYGGTDFYDGGERLGWSRPSNGGYKYYNRQGVYQQQYRNRIYINRRTR